MTDSIRSWQSLGIPMGSVSLWRGWMKPADADVCYERLVNNLDWQQPSLTIAGRTHKIPRLQAWHGDVDAAYRYSGSLFIPVPWTVELELLRNSVAKSCGATFNSVLVNWYRDGSDGMGFHADNEPELGREPVIASLSLGATRRFVLKPIKALQAQGIDAAPINIELSSGDLLLMRGTTQRYWLHGVPKTRKPALGRLNLTFRQIVPRENSRNKTNV